MPLHRGQIFWLRDTRSGDYHAHAGVISLCGRHTMPMVIARLNEPGEPICAACEVKFQSIPSELEFTKAKRAKRSTPIHHES